MEGFKICFINFTYFFDLRSKQNSLYKSSHIILTKKKIKHQEEPLQLALFYSYFLLTKLELYSQFFLLKNI